MPQQPQRNNQQPPAKTELNEEIIKSIIDQQSRRLQLDESRLRLEEKRVEQDGKFAEQSLKFNAEILKATPGETRKTATRLAWIIGGFVVLGLGFLTWWIHLGKEEFAYKFLQGLSYLATSVLSFLAGQKIKFKKGDNKSSEIEDAEVID